jgi:chorismate-pyruvate lyase
MIGISEQPTEKNIQQLIDKLPKEINPLERVILCHDGTVQTLLSVLFGVQVKVEVLSQQELPDIGILRWTKLVAVYPLTDMIFPGTEVTACLAESIIPYKNNPERFLNAIRERSMGIGQIIKSTGLKQERHVFGLYSDENVIARNYRITGDVELIITETFPRDAINKAGKII